MLRYSQQVSGISSILLHGLPHQIVCGLFALASYLVSNSEFSRSAFGLFVNDVPLTQAAILLLLDMRASAKAAQLRLARKNNPPRGSGDARHRIKQDDLSQRLQAPNDPFDLISLINNVTSPHATRIPSTHDPVQPRSSPMVQLSPSPEMETLLLPNILPALDDTPDSDSMDWEATGPGINSATTLNGSPPQSTFAKSAWDRFATTKQRIFVKEQLTGLERAFETWRDLGGSTIPETTLHYKMTATASTKVHTRRRSTERAVYMLAAVLRILSLALTWGTGAKELCVDIGRGNGTGFGIAASVLEAALAGPQVVSSQTWAMKVSMYHLKYDSLAHQLSRGCSLSSR